MPIFLPESQTALRAVLNRAQSVLQALQAVGGRPLIVGGAVRDALLGTASGDIDIEVYGIDVQALRSALQPLGKLHAVGRSFGVLKLRLASGDEFDIAIPSRISRNHGNERGVLPDPDPTMTPQEAAARRDFTWNALALAPDGQILDFFNGIDDLQQGVLRHVSPLFGEDSLRVLRAMRFAARFDMQLAPETAALCRSLLPTAETIAIERIWGEWARWALEPYPQAGLQALEASGWLALYPQLAALQGCPQSPRYHPEGDVWVHTGFVCAAAAAIARRDALVAEQRQVLLFAALCHDFGKPLTTVTDADGIIRSPNHAQAGNSPAKTFLQQIGAGQWLSDQVLPLVREHMAHFGQPTPRAVRRLASRLAPASIVQWAQLVEADVSGRPPLPPGNPAAPFFALAHQLNITKQPPAPLLDGRLLIAAGYPAGPSLGALLKQAYQAQLDGTFVSAEEGLQWLAEQP